MIKGAGVVLIRKGGAVYLLHRTPNAPVYPNLWNYVGGRVEKGETVEQAALRELEEETGYKTVKINFLLSNIYQQPNYRVKRHVFWCEYDGAQEVKCLEGQEGKFMFYAEIEKKEMVPEQKEIIKLALDAYRAQK